MALHPDPDNELYFRRLNVSILRTAPKGENLDAVCECADIGCFASIGVPSDEFERIRSQIRHFIVAPGHVFPELELIVERHEGFHVVEKTTPALHPSGA
jgi:hypothetical protein